MNAMDAIGAIPLSRRAITVGTRMTETDLIEVVVSDRGTGIASGDRARVLEPFFTTKDHGLGLGLSICSTIVNSHGGELNLDNNDDGGRGRRFLTPADTKPDGGCKMTMFGFTIAVVDDDSGVLKALSRLLRMNGLSAETFSSPLEFLRQHDPSVPGCAILDVSMPGLDGLNLQQQLAARHAEFPVIFLTGKGDIPTGIRAMKAGAVDFLTKPVKGNELLTAIAQARERVAETTKTRAQTETIKAALSKLTPREHEVLGKLVDTA